MTSSSAIYKELLGRSTAYELLSIAFLYPQKGAKAELAQRTDQLTSLATSLGWATLHPALQSLAEELDSIKDETLISLYVDLVGHSVPKDCPPYEGEYDQAHIFQKTQALADLTAFYQAFGVALSPQVKERPDHVSVELEFMHLLITKEAYARLHKHGPSKVRLCRQAQESFLSHHLASWIKPFAHRAARKAPRGTIYHSLAHLLDLYMDREFEMFPISPAISRPNARFETEEELDCQGCFVSATTIGD